MFNENDQKIIAEEIIESQSRSQKKFRKLHEWQKADGGWVFLFYQGYSEWAGGLDAGRNYNNGIGCVISGQVSKITDADGKEWTNPQKVGSLWRIEFVDINYKLRFTLENLKEFGWTDEDCKKLLDFYDDKRI